jgi:putative phosphoribosyl transferase
MTLANNAQGLVIFVHGSGSSRLSKRNRYVARLLDEGGFSTLLADLLTPEEETLDARTAELRFDIPMLARRTISMIDWAHAHEPTKKLPVGLFGASTGAAAAIIAAAERPEQTRAVVSRGGRGDLAGPWFERLQAPLLLIVGTLDYPVLELHEQMLPRIRAQYRYETIPGATHLFEEPGTLDAVAKLAAAWFKRYL